ncbi:FAD-dependent oxidoreductase [Legionella shakespearei]|uniref:FAD binding domain protein n=1 Tax=Legionella shakespearei DSM 23087 TaxID=1122169 RepID=A0A0W0YVR2_9GAMM|nr:FAD-dependent monooxygenase [Legionella shakespearei]KTD60973.1 FAD binding domain protein [Legionella shakespearei DSM 23087]
MKPENEMKIISISYKDGEVINDEIIRQIIEKLMAANLIHERLDCFYQLLLQCKYLLEEGTEPEQKVLLDDLAHRAEAMVMAIIGSNDPEYIKKQMALRTQCKMAIPDFMPWQKRSDLPEELLLRVPEEEVVADKADNVVYLDKPEERETYRIVRAGDGLIKRLSFSRSPQGGTYELTPFDTGRYRGHGESGSSIIVITPNGDLFAGSTKECAFYHSSFTAAAPLYFAGKFVVEQGKIRKIDNRSGHYRTPPKALVNAISYIGEQYFILNESLATQIQFVYDPKINEDHFVTADYTFTGGISTGEAELKLKLNHYDVIISGMGPSGLATAIELVDLGYSVMLVDKRDAAYLRPQIVYLTKGSREYLKSLLIGEKTKADEKFLTYMQKSWGIGIKDIERFLHAQLEKRMTSPGVKVSFLRKHRIAEVSLDAGRLVAEPDYKPDHLWKEFSFDMVIGADGSNHYLADVLSRKDQSTIEYLTESDAHHTIYTPRNWRNASLYAELRRKDGKPFKFPFIQFIALPGAKTTDDEPPFAYCLYYLMFAHSYTNQEVTKAKFNAGIELPQSLYEHLKKPTTKREDAIVEIIKYIETGLFERLSQHGFNPDEFEVVCTTPSKKSGPNKDQVKFFLFNTQITCANKAYVQTPSGKIFLLLGDAFRRPFFHISHGINDALFTAELIAHLMSKPQRITLQDYDEVLRRRSNEVSEMTEELGKYVTCYARRWDETKAIETVRLSMFHRKQPVPEIHERSDLHTLPALPLS